jgi:hypothetical protein
MALRWPLHPAPQHDSFRVGARRDRDVDRARLSGQGQFVVTDRATGKAWWQYGAATEAPEAASAKRMSSDQLRDRIAALGASGIFNHS